MTQLSTLIESEIADFFAGFGGPGEPDIQSGEAQRLLTDRINRLLAAEAQKPVRYLNKFTGVCVTLEQQPDAATDTAVYVPLFDAPQPVAVADELVNELLGIATKAAEEADEYGHYEFNDNSESHTKAIANWEQRAAMLAAEPVSQPYTLPDGWKLVPVEPTEKMINAWLSEVANWRGHVEGYKAMLAAAPQELTK